MNILHNYGIKRDLSRMSVVCMESRIKTGLLRLKTDTRTEYLNAQPFGSAAGVCAIKMNLSEQFSEDSLTRIMTFY